MIYISYWICYIIPLLQNWNNNVTKNPLEYPFAFTSTNKNSKTKGLTLGLMSGFFVILLSINLLRTIFCDPGYFPNALELEYQIVIKNLLHQEENKKEIIKVEKKNKNNDNNDIDNEEENEKKRNYFKIEKLPKEKSSKKKEELKFRRNPSEQIYYEHEKSIEIYKEDALNLLHFSEKISETPICYEEYNKRADFLEEWSYKINNNNNKKNEEKEIVILNGNEKININNKRQTKNPLNDSKTELDIFVKNNNNNNDNNNKKIENFDYDTNAFDGYIGYDVGKAFLCGSCVRLKVERSHHCKQCGKCVLKMDHHCPWLANCIGYKNYKFFLLTHLYGSISCFIVLASYWETFVNAYVDTTKSIAILCWHLFVFVCTFGLFSFLIWLLVVNWMLMFEGLTVIENADRERFPSAKFNNNFDLGWYRNFKSVFGDNCFIWFLPIMPNDKYKGLYFEKKDNKHERLMMLL